ncbi:neural proliferation differentiation and control protein 1-like [Stegostoma tigrinum]|uniref:neural proliferation differentiation and control protein 1-like n=1 Tax=Stegostoma tigrinum TaxID=3053191 RepID=UPI00202B8EE4|nr:neural proliferation differentiation and control protein 1-like [Stegostoma tigrinum]
MGRAPRMGLLLRLSLLSLVFSSAAAHRAEALSERGHTLAPARDSHARTINPESSQTTEKSQSTVRTTAQIHSRNASTRHRTSSLLNDVVSLSLVIICSVSGLFGLGVAGLCWYRLQEVRQAEKAAYDGNKKPQIQAVDWKMVAKLQKHQYLHQKKALQAMEEGRPEVHEKQISTDLETESENGEYTVYECPGLAQAGEMEIYNPLFNTSVLGAGPSKQEH